MREALFHPAFPKDLKRLPKPLIKKLQEAIENIQKNPELGDKLLGDLSGYYSYHFKYGGVDYRLGYRLTEKAVFFLMLKTRENYYEMLKKRI
jgi:mRNA-degrading endonuclease RelE of RelBE toxin-antitoxin system